MRRLGLATRFGSGVSLHPYGALALRSWMSSWVDAVRPSSPFKAGIHFGRCLYDRAAGRNPEKERLSSGLQFTARQQNITGQLKAVSHPLRGGHVASGGHRIMLNQSINSTPQNCHGYQVQESYSVLSMFRGFGGLD